MRSKFTSTASTLSLNEIIRMTSSDESDFGNLAGIEAELLHLGNIQAFVKGYIKPSSALNV
jgi:hypothetical protein